MWMNVDDDNCILPSGGGFRVLLIDRRTSLRTLVLHLSAAHYSPRRPQAGAILHCPLFRQNPIILLAALHSGPNGWWGGIIRHDSHVVSLRKWGAGSMLQGREVAFHLFKLTSRNPDSRWTIGSSLCVTMAHGYLSASYQFCTPSPLTVGESSVLGETILPDSFATKKACDTVLVISTGGIFQVELLGEYTSVTYIFSFPPAWVPMAFSQLLLNPGHPLSDFPVTQEKPGFRQVALRQWQTSIVRCLISDTLNDFTLPLRHS